MKMPMPPPNPSLDIREDWRRHLKTRRMKYFVIKAEEFLEALSAEEARKFNILLRKYERYREESGKCAYNNYYVVNRDENYANVVKDLIEANEGIQL